MINEKIKVRVGEDRLLVNPSYFYNGDPRELPAKIQEFYDRYSEKHGTRVTFKEDFALQDNDEHGPIVPLDNDL
jgi:hypothetical protein